MLAWLTGRDPGRVLVLGPCGPRLGADLRAAGHDVVVVADRTEDADDPSEGTIVADIDDGVPPVVGTGFDVVLLVDALGRVRDPDALLLGIRELLAPGGVAMASVPNFGHWYVRSKVLAGRWGYDRRGLLDEQTLRFFTPRDVEARFRSADLSVTRTETVGLPLEPGRDATMSVVDGVGLALRPSLFAYQYLYELTPPA
jgi:SAM-dependent methyltransferase